MATWMSIIERLLRVCFLKARVSYAHAALEYESREARMGKSWLRERVARLLASDCLVNQQLGLRARKIAFQSEVLKFRRWA